MRANDKTGLIDLYRKNSGSISLQRGDIGAGIMIGYDCGNGITRYMQAINTDL